MPQSPADSEPPAVPDLVVADAVLLAARDRLLQRDTPTRRQALALSGGGIRSATFALGSLQAMAETSLAPQPPQPPQPLSQATPPAAPDVAPRPGERFRHTLLGRFDYLSTVSGGGYIGAFLVSLFVPARLRPESDTPLAAADDVVGVLASGAPGRIHGDASYSGQALLRAPLAWLRENGRYLIPTGVGDALYAAALGLRGWVAVHFVIGTLLLAVLTLLALARTWLQLQWPWLAGWESAALGWALGQQGLAAIWWSPLFPAALLPLLLWGLPVGVGYWLSARDATGRSAPINVPVLGMLAAAALLVWLAWQDPSGTAPNRDGFELGMALKSLTLRQQVFLGLALQALLGIAAYAAVALKKPAAGEQRVVMTRWLSSALIVAVAIAALASIDTLGRSLYLLSVMREQPSAAPALTPAALVAALVWLAKKGAALGAKSGSRAWWQKLPLPLIGGLAGLLIFTLIATLWCMALYGLIWLGERPAPLNPPSAQQLEFLLLLATASLGLAVLTGQFPSFINLSSLQSFYAARLTRAYLGASNGQRYQLGRAGLSAAEPLPGDKLTLSQFVDVSNAAAPRLLSVAPLHIVNVTLNKTVDPAEQLVQRDRKGQPLAVLPQGFAVDGRLHAFPPAGHSSEINNLPDLGQWVGTSGAAFSTGIGRETSLGMSLLMGAANVRLGTWWASGQGRRLRPRRLGWVWATLGAVFRTQAYLSYELRARFFGLQRAWQYLSDGGHFENTGIYELLRAPRDVGLIVACDCGADPLYRFDDLANLIRLARIDLGVEIAVFNEFGDQPLLARCFGTPTQFSEAVKPYAVLLKATRIDGSVPSCWIILLKPALHARAPADVLQYAAQHPAFPQEPTTDQFFDEAQWESYRSLGHFIAQQVLTSETLAAVEALVRR